MVAKLQSMAYKGFMSNLHSRVWIEVVIGFRIRNRDIVMNNIRSDPGCMMPP